MNKKVVRTYKLRCYPNASKLDTARYAAMRTLQWTNTFLGPLFFDHRQKIKTVGMGTIANNGLYKARIILSAQRASTKSTGNKANVPVVENTGCYATIESSKAKAFDYWIKVPNEWKKLGRVSIPAKSHKALNRALKDGWILSKLCNFKVIAGVPYAFVYVQKNKPKTKKPKSFIGVDVGMKHSVISSGGYLGFGLSPVIRKQKQRHAERRRQGHNISNKCRSEVKQLLDREAKIMLRRSQLVGAGLAVESPKRIANLRSGSLQGWARSYFANRLHVLGKETGTLVLDINPAYTSQTCSSCGVVDKESRVSRDLFACKACGFNLHADVNAARNLALKGTLILEKILARRSGRVIPERERLVL